MVPPSIAGTGHVVIGPGQGSLTCDSLVRQTSFCRAMLGFMSAAGEPQARRGTGQALLSQPPRHPRRTFRADLATRYQNPGEFASLHKP